GDFIDGCWRARHRWWDVRAWRSLGFGYRLGRRWRCCGALYLWGFEAIGDAALIDFHPGIRLIPGVTAPSLHEYADCDSQCDQYGEPEEGPSTTRRTVPGRF